MSGAEIDATFDVVEACVKQTGSSAAELAQKCGMTESMFRADPHITTATKTFSKLAKAKGLIEQLEALEGGFALIGPEAWAALITKCTEKMRADEARIAHLEAEAAKTAAERRNAETVLVAAAQQLQDRAAQAAVYINARFRALDALASASSASSSAHSSSFHGASSSLAVKDH